MQVSKTFTYFVPLQLGISVSSVDPLHIEFKACHTISRSGPFDKINNNVIFRPTHIIRKALPSET